MWNERNKIDKTVFVCCLLRGDDHTLSTTFLCASIRTKMEYKIPFVLCTLHTHCFINGCFSFAYETILCSFVYLSSRYCMVIFHSMMPQQLNRMTTGYNCSPFCMWSPTLMNIETINWLVFKKAIGQFNCKQKREWEVGFKFNIVVIPLAGWFKTACFSENAILNWFRCVIKRKKSFRLVSFRRCVCVRATHNPHHEMKDLHRMNKSWNKKPLWKIFRNHWAVRLPYTFAGGVETQNIYFYTNVCTVSEFESVSHFSSISHSLCFSLWLLFYEDVWVFAGRHRVLSKYLFIPCFVALQKYDYKNATKQMCMT